MAIAAIHDVPAPAKLNLTLRIVGRRADGYHLLDSMVVLIDWCDTLHFERRADGGLARHDLGAALPEDDLCLRAARALQVASGTALGADIHIDKQVPWGAGLGGGSSDAASTLLALNRLWSLDWPLDRLLRIGLVLGADVPFFLVGGNSRMRGIGEQLLPFDAEPAWFAVLKPSGSLATQAVFRSRQVAERVEAARIAGFSEAVSSSFDEPAADRKIELEAAFGDGQNDLQAAAEGLLPDVAQAAELLFRTYGNSRMTGSGSAVFAYAGKADHGSAPPAAMPAVGTSGWRGRMCRSLRPHPLAGWSGADGRS